MSSVGPAELLSIVWLVGLFVPTCAMVDALVRPDSQWAAAHQSKTV